MYTRKQYMDGDVTRRQYYGQFVSPEVTQTVLRAIGREAIMASTDEYFNDIPLRKWEAVIGFADTSRPCVNNTLGAASALRQAGDDVSAVNLIRILQEAAQQIKEG